LCWQARRKIEAAVNNIQMRSSTMPSDLPPRWNPAPGNPFGPAVERLRAQRGWIVAFGAFCALLGLVALVLTDVATIASVLVIGIFMAAAGIVEIVIGLRTRTWGRMLLWEATGLLYLIAGLFAIAMPAPASVIITLMLGAGLLATGVLRVFLGTKMVGSPARSAIIGSGIVTMLLGLLIVLSWPSSSIVVLGTLLGIDLLVYGLGWILFGYRLGIHRS
jgi:uncharacterized membrane protein HdeD (DUF308 family)